MEVGLFYSVVMVYILIVAKDEVIGGTDKRIDKLFKIAGK